MSNVLKVSKQTTISELHAKGWSLRRIALELGLNRRTVAAYANRSQKLGCDSSSNFTAEVTGGPPTERPASKAVLSQNTETFLRCLENAFRHFGGVPKVLNVDNLKAAVLRADWFDPEINPKFEAFCQHYGTSVMPCRPYTPQHKGKVERGICHVKNSALKGHDFESLAAENAHLAHWEKTVADTRIHGTTKRQVAKHFAQGRPFLQALPASSAFSSNPTSSSSTTWPSKTSPPAAAKSSWKSSRADTKTDPPS